MLTTQNNNALSDENNNEDDEKPRQYHTSSFHETNLKIRFNWRITLPVSAFVSGIIRDKSAKVCSASNAEHSSEQKTAKRMKLQTQTCFFSYENIQRHACIWISKGIVAWSNISKQNHINSHSQIWISKWHLIFPSFKFLPYFNHQLIGWLVERGSNKKAKYF